MPKKTQTEEVLYDEKLEKMALNKPVECRYSTQELMVLNSRVTNAVIEALKAWGADLSEKTLRDWEKLLQDFNSREIK